MLPTFKIVLGVATKASGEACVPVTPLSLNIQSSILSVMTLPPTVKRYTTTMMKIIAITERTRAMTAVQLVSLSIVLDSFLAQQRMELQERRLKRSEINRICDAVLPIPSLDKTASEVHTSVVRERIRDQLIGISLIPTEEAIGMLISYIVNRQTLAFVKDDTNVGLPASEAASAGIAQASMSAFKATSYDMSLATIVNQMNSVFSTVIDRSDQKVITHFDPAYAKNKRNYTLREVADMRSIFVRTTLEDLVLPDKTIIGVFEDYDGDGSTPAAREAVRRIKRNFQQDSACSYIEPGRWNRVRAMKPDGIGIICMRLHIDAQLAYSRGISMNMIISKISDLMIDLNCSIVASGMQEGIIDILSREIGGNSLRILSELERVRTLFSTVQLSGLDTVNSMTLERIDLIDLITSYNRASEYHVAQLGMTRWLIANQRDGILSWRDLEEDSYLVTEEELQSLDPSLLLLLGSIGEEVCIFFPGYGGRRASSDELTQLYIAYYCQDIRAESIDNLWVLRLDVISMKVNCIDLELILSILDYCGIATLSIELSRTSQLVEYLYIESEENPKDVVRRHFDKESYLNMEGTLLSSVAGSRVARLVRNLGETARLDVLQNIESEFLNTMSKYYYAVLNVTKKKSTNKEGGPVIKHVASHTYTKILRYPFVSREKTTCNDWYTMNYVLGADAAKNNYIIETMQLFQRCDIQIDPRHLDLISDYVFERGEPAGMGLVPMKKHGIGFTHEFSTQNTTQQLSGGHLRAAEASESYTISTFMGTPPVGPRTKIREVEQARRLEEMQVTRMSLRGGQNKKVVIPKSENVPAQNSDAIDIAIRSMFLDTDPYFTVPTFKLPDARVPESPEELVVTARYSQSMIERVRNRTTLATIVGRLELLREYVGHIKKVPELDSDQNILDMEKLQAFFEEHSSYFS